MSNSRHETLADTKWPQCITYELDVPVFVIPLAPPEPYRHVASGFTRYRIRALYRDVNDELKLRQITLPQTATQYFINAAQHGGYVAVTMSQSSGGIRYWSRRVEVPLTEDEHFLLDQYRVPEEQFWLSMPLIPEADQGGARSEKQNATR